MSDKQNQMREKITFIIEKLNDVAENDDSEKIFDVAMALQDTRIDIKDGKLAQANGKLTTALSTCDSLLGGDLEPFEKSALEETKTFIQAAIDIFNS